MENCLEQFFYFGFYFWIAAKCVTLHYIKSLKWHKFSFYVVVFFMFMNVNRSRVKGSFKAKWFHLLFFFFLSLFILFLFLKTSLQQLLYVKLFSFIENNFCNIKNTLNNIKEFFPLENREHALLYRVGGGENSRRGGT